MTTVTEADPGATSIDERAAYATPRVVPSSEGRPVIVWEDRRATPRRDMTARVVLRHGERISVGVSENVSEGGIFVASFETYPPGTELDLVFSVPGVGAPEIAVRASVYLTLLGPQGLRETAELCHRKAQFLAAELCRHERFSLAFPGPFFKEFVIRDAANDVAGLLARAQRAGYLAGIPLGDLYPELSDCLLIAVTEKRTRAQLEGLVEVLTARASAPVAV